MHQASIQIPTEPADFQGEKKSCKKLMMMPTCWKWKWGPFTEPWDKHFWGPTHESWGDVVRSIGMEMEMLPWMTHVCLSRWGKSPALSSSSPVQRPRSKRFVPLVPFSLCPHPASSVCVPAVLWLVLWTGPRLESVWLWDRQLLELHGCYQERTQNKNKNKNKLMGQGYVIGGGRGRVKGRREGVKWNPPTCIIHALLEHFFNHEPWKQIGSNSVLVVWIWEMT